MFLLWEQKEPKILGMVRFLSFASQSAPRIVNSLRSDRQHDINCQIPVFACKAKKLLTNPEP